MKLSEIIKENPGLLREAKKCKSEKELQVFFDQKGIHLQQDIVAQAFKFVQEADIDKLKDPALDSVSGGIGAIAAGGNVGNLTVTEHNINTETQINSTVTLI